MTKTTNGKPCRLLSCPFAGLRRRETIYANWDMLIGIEEQGKPQHWRGLAGHEKPENRAVFYNIYEGKGFDLVSYLANAKNTVRAVP